MSEQLPEPSHSEDAPRPDKYEKESAIESFIFNVMLRGKELSDTTFPTVKSATKAANEFVGTFSSKDNTPEEIYATPLIVRGEGVTVLDIQVDTDTAGEVSISHDPDRATLPLAVIDSRTVVYRTISAQVTKNQNDTYNATPYIHTQDLYNITAETGKSAQGWPLAKIFIQSTVLIACDRNLADVQSIKLEKYRRHQAALKELELSTDAPSELIEEIRLLEETLSTELPDALIELPQADLLRRIGKKSLEYAASESPAVDYVNEAVEATLGNNRYLEISGKIYGYDQELGVSEILTDSFGGTVAGVVSKIPQMDTHPGSTLAMNALNNDKLCYVPLTDITSLKF